MCQLNWSVIKEPTFVHTVFVVVVVVVVQAIKYINCM